MVGVSRWGDQLARVRSLRGRRPQTGAVLALAAAAALVTWLIVGRGGGSSKTAATTPAATTSTEPARTYAPIGPVTLTLEALRARVESLGQEVYWVGPEPDKRYGLTRNAKGEIFLRYLPSGTSADAQQQLLTIGTYPLKGAFAATQSVAAETGTVYRNLAGGGLAAYRRDKPTNVYVAYPKLEYQIEVFSPSAAQAHALAFSKRVRRIH
jgi:hypothetical protein